MSEESKRRVEIQRLLRERFRGKADSRGYVTLPEENLIDGVRMGQFESDLRRGAGNELEGKFCAVHSSSALVVNTFARFKDKPDQITLSGQSGFTSVAFEQRMPTGLGGTPPTLDVVLRRNCELFAIESKFLEYFTKKKAKFADSYNRKKLPWAESCWWQVMKKAEQAEASHFDVAQLVKHYLGLSRLLTKGDQSGWKPAKVTLLYLFWEPLNWEACPLFKEHRKQVEQLKKCVSRSSVTFCWMTYADLLDKWSEVRKLKAHVGRLKARYEVRL